MNISFILQLLLLIHSLYSFTKNRFVYSRQLFRHTFINPVEARLLSSLVDFPDHEERWDEGEVSWNITDVPKKNNRSEIRILRLDYSERLAFLFI